MTVPVKRRVFPVACITGIGRPDVRRMPATSTSDLSAMGNVMNDNKRNIRSERSVPARHRLCAGMLPALASLGDSEPVYGQRTDKPHRPSLQASTLGEAANNSQKRSEEKR